MIRVKHISKTFQVSRRNSGFSEAFKALFHRQYECIKALGDISFTIEVGEMGNCYINRIPNQMYNQNLEELVILLNWNRSFELWQDNGTLDKECGVKLRLLYYTVLKYYFRMNRRLIWIPYPK